jgi:hypothetical protein
MGDVERPRLYRTLRSFLVPQMSMPIVSLWWSRRSTSSTRVEVELAGVFGLKLAGFEFDDDIAELFDVEEQEVDVEVISVDVEVHLPADEGESGTQFAEGLGDPAGERVLEVALGDLAGEAEELEVVWVLRYLLG